MSFYNVLKEIEQYNLEDRFKSVTKNDIKKILEKDFISKDDFIKLLSPTADFFLEEMAIKSQEITQRYFGNTIQLFSPLYVSNYCENDCSYCGYRANSGMKRKQLTLEEVEEEAKAIHKTGIRQVLILTGEARKSSTEYVLSVADILKKYFPMLGIEIKALTLEEYKKMYNSDVKYLTIYQETYDEEDYKIYHKVGPKANFRFRIDAPERGAKAGFIGVSIGALLGLSDLKKEILALGMHGKYLREHFPELELSFSLPRLRPTKGGYEYKTIVTDRLYVQMLLALRLFHPRAGITLSTREKESFRENLLRLGVTKFSAGVKTSVGGYSQNNDGTEQFNISDYRSVEDVSNFLLKRGKQPVFIDWF